MNRAYTSIKYVFRLITFIFFLFQTNAHAQPVGRPDLSLKNSPLLNFEKAKLDPSQQNASSLTVGPFNNINFGGAVDMRLYAPQSHGPTYSHLGAAHFDLHVVELFLTTNIGDHISLLLEQLLITSKMDDPVGQDHGFVYAVFSEIPWLPRDWSLKLGRFRTHFGIDTHLDSATHILRNPAYKNIGIFTDKGLELSGFWKSFDWSVSVVNGIDSVLDSINTNPGHEAEVRRAQATNSKPVVARLGFDLSNNFNLGLSGFSGLTHPVTSEYGYSMSDMLFNARLNEGKIVYKNRYAADMTLKISSKFKIAAEYCTGIDRDEGYTRTVSSAFTRVDYKIIPQKLTLALQYEYFNDGRTNEIMDTGTIGAALSYHLNEQSWLRIGWLQDDRGLFRSKATGPEYMAVAQTFITF
jgi:hypothetical protein